MLDRLLRRRRATLAHCPACGTDFVHPLVWSPHDDDHWWMVLRCGGCAEIRERVVPDAEADLFDLELDRAQEMIRASANRLGRESMAEDARAFAAALRRDLICADDFAR